MLFPDDPFVIEFMPETRLRPDIYLLAGVLGLKYECLVSPANEDDNMSIDIEALRELLARNNL